MKKRIIIALLINLSIGASKVWGQNTGVGEPNPGSKFSIKGNAVIGAHYSTLQAPANGILIEGQTAIGTSSPVPSALLDITSTTQGVAIPRMTSTQRNAIVSPVNGLLVFDTNLNAFCFYTLSGWITITQSGTAGATGPTGIAGTNGTDGLRGATGATGPAGFNGVTGPTGPAGSGSANISGTTNYVPKFSSASALGNSAIFDNGTGVGIGTTTPAYPLQITSAATMSAYVYNSHKDHDAVWAHNGASSSTGAGCGIVGITSQSGSMAAGVWGENNNSTGTGVVGFGNAGGAILMAGGSGGAFTGTTTGLFAKSNSSAASQAIYTDNFGSIVRVNYWNGSTQYKIQGAGTVSTVVKDLNNHPVVMHATETPEIYLQDYGAAALVNGKAHINLDPTFAKNAAITSAHPLRVFVQLEGDCHGVFISGKCATGFDVVELSNGTSNTSFQYTVICNRADETLDNGLVSKNADMRFEPAGAVEKTSVAKRKSLKE